MKPDFNFWRATAAVAMGCLIVTGANAQVSQTIGDLAPGDSVTITYEVTINSPLSAAVTQISQQGTVSGGNFTTANTDDPDTGTADDATITLLSQNFDFGDAPTAAQSGFASSYPTLLADTGAKHFIPAGGATLYLGSVAPDAEADGQPDAGATGDDTTGTDDEDGVALPALLSGGQTESITVTVTGGSGFLNAWIDFNRDGDWDDADEQVLTDTQHCAGSDGRHDRALRHTGRESNPGRIAG